LKDKGVSSTAIRAHEDAALWAFIMMEITGFLAWLSLWQYRVIRRVPGWTTPVIVLLSLLSFAAMARTANLGGEIRHPEIASADGTPGAAAPAAAASAENPEAEGTARAFCSFVTGHTYVWPSCETLHFVGLSILFTVVLLVDLRMLGMAKRIS